VSGTTSEVMAIDEASRYRVAMFRLLDQNFKNADRRRFETDLQNKDWFVLLRRQAVDEIVGFTSIGARRIDFAGKRYLVFFSGDTIVRPEFWGSPELPKAWLAHIFHVAQQSPECQPYWLLLSAGFRTYRFMSVFWHSFCPRYDQPTPDGDRELMDRFASVIYGDEYHPKLGIVRFAEPTPLRKSLAEVDPGRLRDPHVAYFLALNPGWIDGDELACLTRVTPDNLTRAGRRMAGMG